MEGRGMGISEKVSESLLAQLDRLEAVDASNADAPRMEISRAKRDRAFARIRRGVRLPPVASADLALALEEENAELKAEIALIQPEDSYMRLPLDADGVPIRIGDKMDIDGEIAAVKGYQVSYKGDELQFIAVTEGCRKTFTLFGKTTSISSTTQCHPTAGRSWKRTRSNSRVSISAWIEPLRRATTARMDGGRPAARAGGTRASTYSLAPRSSRASKRRRSRWESRKSA